ncbi:hypothetical protein SERLA73DRAFT_153398 [Serpula lacrymans var. lacrymans S7.3]|uniref:Uncharacterized protein n=1 Tax=Serpula lacrymans var. lacrymans (strain S7.3) TaxID=936435 RepID=F8PZE8_SERL3|nr:hypothetical protein SERLA73DRAFT_153398 [Serpula lacrymans var. lacrymans S7.3]
MNRDLVHIGAVLVIGTTVTYIFTQCTTCSARNGMTPAPPMHTVGQNNNDEKMAWTASCCKVYHIYTTMVYCPSSSSTLFVVTTPHKHLAKRRPAYNESGKANHGFSEKAEPRVWKPTIISTMVIGTQCHIITCERTPIGDGYGDLSADGTQATGTKEIICFLVVCNVRRCDTLTSLSDGPGDYTKAQVPCFCIVVEKKTIGVHGKFCKEFKEVQTSSVPTRHIQHFGRMVHALCSIRILLKNGVQHMDELVGEDGHTLSVDLREPRERAVFERLMQMVPGLDTRLQESSSKERGMIADFLLPAKIQQGSSGAQSDDTKSLKGLILNWVTPPIINLCLTKLKQSSKAANWLSKEINGYSYNLENPWNGAFCSSLLVSAYKHNFTSPSSVDKGESKATRSSNAQIHEMVMVTPASIAYVATQVKFALCSSPIFTKSSKVTDSESFYNSVLDVFDDPDEAQELNDLLTWWNLSVDITMKIYWFKFYATVGQRLTLFMIPFDLDKILGSELVDESEDIFKYLKGGKIRVSPQNL